MEGSGAVQNDLPAGSGSKIVNSKNSVKKQEPEVEKGQKELEFKAQNLQNKIYVMRLVGELWESSAIGEFIQDLTNNNLSLGVIGDRKVIRGFLREQGRKLVLRYQEDYAAVLEKYESLTDTIKQGNLTWNQVNIEIAYLEKSILERKVLKEDVLGVYDPNLTTLCKRIESSKFIRQPKGPIGSCFSILGEWKPIVEHIMQPFLYTFLVDNQNDRNVLEELIDEIYGELVPLWPIEYSQRPCVWVIKFNMPIAQVEKCSKDDFTLSSLMDVLRIRGSDQVVTKFLLDYTRMHRILLFKTQHEAFPILSEAKNLPKDCLMAYTLDFYKVHPHPSFRSVQLEMGDSALGLPENYAWTNQNSTNFTGSQLNRYRERRDDLAESLRSVKDEQLEYLKMILAQKGRLETLQKGFLLLKDISWGQLESVLEILIASVKKSGVGS